jgi:Uma2 family endonuclease
MTGQARLCCDGGDFMTPTILSTPTTPPPANPKADWPRSLKWTRDDLDQMGGLPSIRDRKVMLIDGEILEKAPPGSLATISQLLIENWLRMIFPPDQFCVRGQLGMFFGINTDPVPDIAVVQGTPRTYTRHPRTALLVIEVADSSLAYDIGDKASLYAAAGIADYWVIDVNDRRIHVFRNPQPDPAQHYGYGYAQVHVLGPKESISPLASPGNSVAIIDLLP